MFFFFLIYLLSNSKSMANNPHISDLNSSLIDSLACIGKDTTGTSLSEIQFLNGRTYVCSPYTIPVLGTTYDAFTLSGNH